MIMPPFLVVRDTCGGYAVQLVVVVVVVVVAAVVAV